MNDRAQNKKLPSQSTPRSPQSNNISQETSKLSEIITREGQDRLSTSDILMLQRTIGNQATIQFINNVSKKLVAVSTFKEKRMMRKAIIIRRLIQTIKKSRLRDKTL